MGAPHPELARFDSQIAAARDRVAKLNGTPGADLESARLHLVELERERARAADVLRSLPPPNPNLAREAGDTQPAVPPPPPAFVGRNAFATQRVEPPRRLVQKRRAELLAAERELHEAKAERVRAPDASESRDRLRAAIAGLTERQLDLEAAEGALAAALEVEAASDGKLDECDRLLGASSVTAFNVEIAPLEAEAVALGLRLGELAARSLEIVQAKHLIRARAVAILDELGLRTRLDEYGRSDARRRLSRALREGIRTSPAPQEAAWWTEGR